MRIRKPEKLALAAEQLQTLTPAELTEVTGGNGPGHHRHHHQRHHDRHHNRHHNRHHDRHHRRHH
jgi:hypothetical protein